MTLYKIKYGFISGLGAMVDHGVKLVSMYSGSETEALARIKQMENGRWKRYGSDVEVVILNVSKA